MPTRTLHRPWRKILWKIVTNPALEVVVTIAVVLVAAWLLIQTEAVQSSGNLPFLFGHK